MTGILEFTRYSDLPNPARLDPLKFDEQVSTKDDEQVSTKDEECGSMPLNIEDSTPCSKNREEGRTVRRSMPRKFFEGHVLRNYHEWLASPLDERLAKNAVADANNMAARVFHYWRGRDLSKIHGATNEGEYRNELVARECHDFGLVRDVADAHKHVELDRPNRRVTRASQTAKGGMGWGEGGWGEGLFGGAPQLVVVLDDGSKRPLSAIMKNVIEMWKRLLTHWSL